jgi:radical SAM superfamily enzyme YgiQ (UPF0313 family)
MKVLLVYPEFPDVLFCFKHALPFQGKRSTIPPLGLLTISAMLPNTWQKRLVDMSVQCLKDSDLDWADVVFFSGMITQSHSMKEQIARAKQRGKRTVVGGPITSAQDPAISQADHVVEGEAEEIISQIAEDLERGSAKPHYHNPQMVDVTRVPLPDLHLAPMRRYSCMSLQYSRGCPFTCEFCDIIEIYGRRPRTKTPDQICAELDQLYRLGWRGSVFMVDDNFIGNRKNVKALLPRLIEWMRDHKFPFFLTTEASLDLAEDEEMLAMMREAHFTRVFLGVETPVEECLRETTKFQNLRKDLLESVRLIQAYGMEVMAGFIVGFDNDPPDVFDRQIEFIRKAAIPLSYISLLNAMPNTQLWRRLKAEGRLLKSSPGDSTPADLTFIPRMDSQELLDGYRRILETIYNPPEYFQRASASLSQLGSESPSPLVFSFSHLVVLGRSLWWQGLLSNYRRAYWKFLVQSLQRHRRHFRKAITLAIMGHQFFASVYGPELTTRSLLDLWPHKERSPGIQGS